MKSEHIYKSHNKTLLLYHLVFPAKYRKKVFDEIVDVTLKEICEETKELFISEGFENFKADYISFSGGIGEYIGKINAELRSKAILKHNDLGPILGYCICKEFEKYKERLLVPKEKIN